MINMKNGRKGLIEIDFILAIGFFIFLLATVAYTATDYITKMESSAEVDELTSEVTSLTILADDGFYPGSWNGTGTIDRIGLATRAYRFYIIIENSQSFLVDQTKTPKNIQSELMTFNYSAMGFSNADMNSTYISDGTDEVPYSINGMNITFATGINVNQKKTFTIYFDDDSNFTSRSQSVSGINNLTETVLASQPLQILQYRKMMILNSSNYTYVANQTGTADFRITLQDAEDRNNVIDYGGELPRTGNIVSYQRYVIYQNSTAGIRSGKLLVKMW